MSWVLVAAAGAALALALWSRRHAEAPGLPSEPGESLEDFAWRTATLQGTVPEEGMERWITCPICRCPSRERYCAMCEWEPELSEAGDDLSERRDFFRGTGTVYSSFELAEWAGRPPSEEERALQRQILEVTARGRTGEIEPFEWWGSFMDLENHLRRARADRVTAMEGE